MACRYVDISLLPSSGYTTLMLNCSATSEPQLPEENVSGNINMQAMWKGGGGEVKDGNGKTVM